MPSSIDGLEPRRVWEYFAELSKIPRCSKQEAAAARFIVDTAARLQLPARQDRCGNVIVRKPASHGHAHAPGVCLQVHLDMVCEKRPSASHDFSTDPIVLVRRGDVVMADGTTLGADNGIAVATNLTLMEDRSVEHGPLELLFTVDEETGLTGAHNLEPGFVTSRTLLNLDSEEEGALYVGCAGGKDTTGTWTVAYESPPHGLISLEVAVSGLRGGHSGLDIDKGRGNALKLLARLVSALAARGARLARIEGGNKRNAIPREARALLYVADAASAEQLVLQHHDMFLGELASVDPGVRVAATRSEGAAPVLRTSDQAHLLQALTALPHGVIRMSAEIPALVETSTNLAVVESDGDTVTVATSQRSSVGSQLLDIVDTVSAILQLAGARVQHSDGYPGWKPDPQSPILKTAVDTYTRLSDRAPAIKAVHAGLECGIIGEKFPGIDMISFGPTLEGVHSPDERISIDSVIRFWEFLLALLKAVSATA